MPQAGLAKTTALAERHGCAERVTPVCADILTWKPAQGPGSMGAVVLSFCHVTAESRPAFMAGVRDMLKPGACQAGLVVVGGSG